MAKAQEAEEAGRDDPEHLCGVDAGVRATALGHHADPGPQRVGRAGRVGAEDADLAGVGGQEPLADLHGRGLARPVRSEQGQHGPDREIEVEAVDGGEAAVPLHQAPDRDSGWRATGHDAPRGSGLGARPGSASMSAPLCPASWWRW